MPFVHRTLSANGTTILGAVAASKAILDMIQNDQVLSMVVNGGGTGYVVGETFEVSTGTAVAGMVARGVVTAESGGVVSAVKILSAGAYSTLPGATAQATANASAAGNDDLTVDLTTQTARWTEDRGITGATNPYVDDATDFEWLCTSVKSTNAPTVGMETDTGGANGAVRVLTASGYSGGSAWTGQPGAPPSDLAYCSVAQSGTIDVYCSITERRVNFVIRNGNNVQYGVIGLFIPFTNTDANYPFPGICAGQSDHINANTEAMNRSAFSGAGNAGIVNATDNNTAPGAYQYRDNLSPSWYGIGEGASNDERAVIWPQQYSETTYGFNDAPTVSGKSTNPWARGGAYDSVLGDSANGWFADSDGNAFGVPGVAPLGAGSRLTFHCKVHIISELPGDVQPIGIVDGYEACHGIGLTAFEEIETENLTKRFMVFPDTNTTELKRWVAMEKN